MKKVLAALENTYVFFSPAFTTIWIYFFVILGNLPMFFLVGRAKELHYLFMPLFLLYLASLIATGRYLQHRKQMREMKAQYGEELFYRMFPSEIKREARIAKLQRLLPKRKGEKR